MNRKKPRKSRRARNWIVRVNARGIRTKIRDAMDPAKVPGKPHSLSPEEVAKMERRDLISRLAHKRKEPHG